LGDAAGQAKPVSVVSPLAVVDAVVALLLFELVVLVVEVTLVLALLLLLALLLPGVAVALLSLLLSLPPPQAANNKLSTIAIATPFHCLVCKGNISLSPVRMGSVAPYGLDVAGENRIKSSVNL